MTDTAAQVVSEPFAELVERIEREADEGFFHTAAQMVVLRRGETVLDVALGRTHMHEPFRADTLSALYCTAKPLVSVAVLALVADDELSLSDQLGHVVPALGGTWMAERTIEQVLGHTAGLHQVNTVLARILPESLRESWMHMMPPPEGWRFGLDRSYAEFGGWFLLGQVIEEIAEQPYADFVESRVVAGYGIDPSQLVVRFGDQSFDELHDRISATFDLTLHQPVPLLAEVGHDTACEWNPAFGSYGTMQAMAAFYDGLLGDLDGAQRVLPAELLAEATTARLPLTWDHTLDREAGFGLGFMAPLSSHYFGDRPSGRAFGHAGQGGTSFAMADPEREVAVAVLFNAGLDADTALTFRRINLVDGIYRALDELD
ncbi:MAG: beta-lactamase family protein [Actinomycetia bacterium]|nr:beta-lactamase family protein [Actinomycetes bacterium]